MKLWSFVCILGLLSACSPPALYSADSIEEMPAASHNRLAILSASPNMNLAPGKLLVLDLRDGRVKESATRIGNDPLLRKLSAFNEIALLDRSHSTILFFDLESLKLKREVRPVPEVDYTGLSDLVELPDGQAYVASYETSWLYRVRLADGTVVSRLSLLQYADEDKIPEAHRLLKVRDTVFLTLQRINREAGFEPTAYSSVLEVDSLKDNVTREHRLIEKSGATCRNPTTALRQLEDGQLIVGCTGSYNNATEGGAIGLIDPNRAEGSYRGVIWSQVALQGKPSELLAIGGGIFFAIGIDNVVRRTAVVHLQENNLPRQLAADPYLTGYRSILYDEVRKLLWLGKVTSQGGQVIAFDPDLNRIVRTLNVEYDPIQLEWLD